MITKTYKIQKDTLEKIREDRTPPKAPRIAFLLNCSSFEREIMNGEGGIYRESFHLT